MSQARLLMVYDKRSTFVGRDVDLLSEDYTVSEFHFNVVPKWKTPVAFLSQFFYLIFRGWTLKKVVCQSAGYLSFLPSVLSKVMPFKCYIIAIGTDASRLPEINYGHYTKPVLKWFATQSYRLCERILPVHKSLHKSTYTYDDIAFSQQGFGHFIPNLSTPVTEVVNGYRHALFTQNLAHNARPKDFLTVAVKLNKAAYFRKGLDLILASARALPQHSFTVVSEFEPLESIPENVTLVKNVSQQELVQIYNAHKFYLQISMFEGFPNALCEAMLCGCVPIGSEVAAIPEIIKDTGYLLKRRDADLLAGLLKEALANPNNAELEPRKRILEEFPVERRKRELLTAISE
ncbi:MAG: glycosyltransferase family 4 protein [Flavobacteriales bacterium]